MSEKPERRLYTAYEGAKLDFLRKHVTGRSHSELAAMFCKEFNVAASRSTIRNVCLYFGLSNKTADHRAHTPRSPEQLQFLRDNVKGKTYRQLTEQFNARFGTSVSRNAIAALCDYHGWSNDLGAYGGVDYSHYTPKQLAFIREHVEGKTYDELSELFNQHFGADTNGKSISGLCRYHKLSNGVWGGFKEGHKTNLGRPNPHAQEIGTEKVNVDGYTIVKDKDGVWRGKHVLIWESVHGPTPTGMVIIFGDGDRANFSIENLHCVTPSEACVFTMRGLKSNSAELAQTGVALARLYAKINQRQKKKDKPRKPRRKTTDQPKD